MDVVILGHNRYQKQEIRLSHVVNRNFVQIPFCVFARMLRYKLNEKGIVLLETEEAYTSECIRLQRKAPELPKQHLVGKSSLYDVNLVPYGDELSLIVDEEDR